MSRRGGNTYHIVKRLKKKKESRLVSRLTIRAGPNWKNLTNHMLSQMLTCSCAEASHAQIVALRC